MNPTFHEQRAIFDSRSLALMHDEEGLKVWGSDTEHQSR
jgi:hypothetical protein